MPLAPIRLNEYQSFPTVQEAVLAVRRAHDCRATATWNNTAVYPQASTDLLRHLLADLDAIVAGIAARAPVDAGEVA